MQANKRFISLLLAALMVLSLSGITGMFAFADDEEIANNIPLRDYFPNINDPDFFDKMPLEETLQDPFTFFTYNGDTRTPEEMPGTNGKVVTEEDWIERREEIKDLLMYYWYGYKWDTPREAITDVSISDPNASNQRTITMTIDNSKDPLAVANGIGDKKWTGTIGTIRMPTDEEIEASPFNKEDGIPFVIGPSDAQFRANGIATVSIGSNGTYATLYPYNATNTYLTTQSGSVMTNAWVVSRILDALEMNPEWGLDPYKSAINGVSIGGKIAHMQSIWDDRVAVNAPCESGGGGLYLNRGLTEGRINYFRGDGVTGPSDAASSGDVSRVASRMQKMTNAEPSHASTLMQSLFKPNKPDETNYTSMYLPFDAHLGIALMAPSELYNPNRAMLGFTNDSMGSWIGPRQQELDMRAAKEVFDFLGSTNIVNRVRNGSHAAQGRDKAIIVAALDYLFNPASTGFKVDYISGWNNEPAASSFATMADAWAAPYEVDSSYIQWSNPKAYTIWTKSEVIGAGLANTVNAYSNAPQVKLTAYAPYPVADASWTPVVRDVMWEMIADVVDGVATFDLSADESKVARYELTTVGEALNNKSVYFQAIDAATALRSGLTRDNTNYNSMYGFSSKLNKGVVELYSKTSAGDVTKMASSFLENAQEGWIYEYGAAHKTAISNGAFIMRKLQMEAMPGFTFEYSFSQTTHFLVASKAPASWGASLEVQNIGPWPNWPVPGGLGSSNGTGADTGARLAVPNRTTNVLTAEDAGAQFSYDIGVKAMVPGSKLVVSFALAMNPDDFAIGFDFSEDFAIEWAEDNKAVTVTFNSFKDDANGFNTYIARLRSGINFITAPIHSSLGGLPKYALNVSSDKKRLVENGEYFDVEAKFSDVASTNALTLTYTYDASKVEYRSFHEVDGLNVLTTTVDAENGTITFVIAKTGGYEIEDIGFARFSVLGDANLAAGTTSVNVAASFVFKDEDGQKAIMSRENVITFKTGNPLPEILTLIDLSNAIDFFGAEIGNDNWSDASLYDINDDNKIDILDITNIASRI